MNERLLSEHAEWMTLAILEVFESMLLDAERRDAFLEIYARVKAGLNVYEAQVNRMWQRLHPMDN